MSSNFFNSLYILQCTECLVVNTFTVGNHAFLFSCTPMALVLYAERPVKSENGGGIGSLYFAISVVSYPYYLICSYTDCITLMEYTCDRWVQLVPLKYVFVIPAI